MTHPKLAAAAILAALALVPGLAQARSHPPLPLLAALRDQLPPQLRAGTLPDTFAYYDGPATNFCAQGSATYLGQDRRRHPCF